MTLGSGGNLWVVPKGAKNKDLAYDFIDITMSKKIQNLLGNNGGVPVAADPAAITDPRSKGLIANFNTLAERDGLAFYPDWPVARLLRRTRLRDPEADHGEREAGRLPGRGGIGVRQGRTGPMTVTVERGGRGGRGSRRGPGSRGGDVVEAHHHARKPRRPRDSYALFLLPGVLAFFAIIVVPFLMNTGVSFTEWQGVGTPKWTGLANYRELLDDSEFWASFRHSLFMVVAMAVVPTVVGLVLAAALFDFVGKQFGSRTVAVLRACFYLPQVLPIAVAGIVWGWILAPENGSLNELLKAIGLGGLQQDWLGDPDLALYTVMGVMVWVQLGYPLVIFMAGLQRVDPQLYEAAELDGAGWWRRFWHITLPQIRPEIYVVLLWCTIAALKVFGAGVRPHERRARRGDDRAVLLLLHQLLREDAGGYGAAISTVL